MYSIVITDSAGLDHTITDGVQELETTTALSNATDSFSFSILNDNDLYAYIEKGCGIIIDTGATHLVSKIDGYITEVIKTLDEGGVKPVLYVSGEDSAIRLNNLYFSGKFYNMEVGALVHAIMSSIDYSTGKTYYQLTEITASAAFIESTPYIISEATYVWKSIGAAIKELAELVGYEWIIYPFAGFKLLMFFDPAAKEIEAHIVDADLEGTPEISDVAELVNRAIVIGGFQQNTDRSGTPQTGTTTISSTTTRTQSFVPTEDYLSSILVYTEHVTDSESSITISIQNDTGTAPDGINISNAKQTVKLAAIDDGGYTEFRFNRDVTLTPGQTYWIVLKGTTSAGVKVGVAGSVLDYVTRYPVRVAVMTNDYESQERYKNHDGTPGIYMEVFRNSKLEDSQIAEVQANEMLMPFPKKTAKLLLRDDSLKAGDIVQLTISEVGIAIDKTMKITSSIQTMGAIFIYNSLEMEEI